MLLPLQGNYTYRSGLLHGAHNRNSQTQGVTQDMVCTGGIHVGEK